MATYFTGSESPVASGGRGGGSSNNFLRGLSQLAESEGRSRYYDYLTGAPARDEAKYNRAKADGRENYRLNLWGDSRAEYAKNKEREAEYNFITGQRESNQNAMSQTGLALEGMGVNTALLDQGESPSKITGAWAAEFGEGIDQSERQEQKSLVARLLGELDAQTKNEESYLKTLRSNPNVLQDPYGRPFKFSPTRLTRDQYTKEFGVDPFAGEFPQEQTQEESPASISSLEEASPSVGGWSPGGDGGFGGVVAGGPQALAAPPSIQPLSPADQMEEQRLQEIGRLGEEQRAENREASPLDLSREILYGESAEPSWYQSDIPTSQLIPTALSQLTEERDGLAGRISSLESPTTRSLQPYTGMYGGTTPQPIISEKGDSQHRSDMAEAAELREQLEGIDFNIERLSPEPTITQDAADTGVTVGSNMTGSSLPIELTLDQRLNPQKYPSLNRDTSAGPFSSEGQEYYEDQGLGTVGTWRDVHPDFASIYHDRREGVVDPSNYFSGEKPHYLNDNIGPLQEVSRTVLPEYLSDGYEGYEMGDGHMSGRISPEEMPTEVQLPPLPPNIQYSERAYPRLTISNWQDSQHAGPEDLPNYPVEDNPDYMSRADSMAEAEDQRLQDIGRLGEAQREGNRREWREGALQQLEDLNKERSDLIDKAGNIETAETITYVISYIDLATGVGGIGKALFRKFGWNFVKTLFKKSADEISEMVEMQAKRQLSRNRAAYPQRFGSGPPNPGAPPALQRGAATKGMSGRFVNRPGMEGINPMMKPPTPAAIPSP